jgi:hypothetical protein
MQVAGSLGIYIGRLPAAREITNDQQLSLAGIDAGDAQAAVGDSDSSTGRDDRALRLNARRIIEGELWAVSLASA